VCWRLGAVRLE